MRVALISVYDDRCYGMRSMASFLRRQGHEVWLLCFKRFNSVLIPDDDRAAWGRMMGGSYRPVVEAHEEGTVFCPYFQPITEREWELLFEKLAAIRPDLIGQTVTTGTYDANREMTERIRRHLPGVPVVWGGVHATVCPEECLQTTDLLCVGEGEHTMAELCADPTRTDIAGLWRRRDGQTVSGPPRPLEQDLDRFPFPSFGENEWLFEDNQAYELLATNKAYFQGIYTIQSGRGCPFSCSYCCHHVLREMHRGQRYLRRRSVENVLAECELRARQLDLPGFTFFDDIFVIDREWIAEFSEKYPRRVGLPFGGFAYPLVSTEEMLRHLREAGMVFIGLGIQTGSDYVGSEIYERRYGSKEILELAQVADRLGLQQNYELLSNCPFESEADCLETLRLLVHMPRPYSMVIKKIVIFPRTRIASLDKPKPNLPEKVFDFWNQLYLVSQHHLLPEEALLSLAQDPYLKANPQIVRGFALGLKRAAQQAKASRDQVRTLPAAQTQPTLRGLLRCAKRLLVKWLPAPVAKALRSLTKRK